MMVYQSVDYIQLGQRIKRKRKSLGLSQAELAFITGLSCQHISNIENGKSKVSLEKLVAIANALHCMLDELVCESLSNNRYIIYNELSEFLKSFTDFEIRFLPIFLKNYHNLCAEMEKRS